MSTEFLFHVWPYAAVAILCAGLVVRYLFALPRMQELASARGGSWPGSGRLLRLALVAVAFAHFVGLVFPRVILGWNESPGRMHLIEIVGWVVGAVALIGWARVVWRHLDTPSSSRLGDFADSIFVSLILVGIASGLVTAIRYRWGSSWGVVTLTPYIASLFADPASVYVSEMPFMVQLHVVTAFASLAMVPFTRLAPYALVAIHRAFVFAGKPISAAGRAAEDFLRRHNPGVRIWPEED
jgi:nitrate reductase gamma subunit